MADEEAGPEEARQRAKAIQRAEEAIEEAKARRELADAMAESEERTLAQKKADEALAAGQLALAKAMGRTAEELKPYVKGLATATTAVENQTKKVADLKAEYESLVGVSKTLITSLTGISDGWKKTSIGLLLNTEGHKAFGEAIKETLTPLNILGSLLKGIQEQTITLSYATDTALVSFAQNTGMQAEFGASIRANEKILRSNGVMIQEVADATSDLAIGYREFTELSGTTRDSMVQMVATLDKMGVSSATQVKSMDILSTAMGRSGMAAAQFQTDVYALGVEVGIGGPQAVEAFAATAPKLAKFGSDAGGVFADLAKAAKDARMEIGELIGIAEQFDTFAGAAEAVGQLNALLGGPFLNSMEMVMATNPAERIGMISEALSTAGKDFETMTYYERQAIANAAGLSDVSELAKIMAGDFDNLTGSLDENAMTQEELNKLTTDFNTIAEEIKQTLMLLAIQMEPAIKLFKGFLDSLQKSGPVLGVITGAIVIFASVVMALKLVIGLASAAMSIFTSVFGLFGAATPPAAGGVTASLTALSGALEIIIPLLAKAIPVLTAFGAAALKVGLAVALSAGSLALFFYSLSFLDPGQLLAGAVALGAFGGALWLVQAPLMALASFVMTGAGGVGLALVVGGLMVLGATMSLVALSSALFAESIAHVFESVTGLVEALARVSGDSFFKAAVGVAALASAIGTLPVIKTVVLTQVFEAGAAYEASMAIREATAAAAAGGAAGGAARPAGINQPIVFNLTAGVDKRTLFTVFEEFNLDIFGSSDPSR